jgi:hypothetical protein
MQGKIAGFRSVPDEVSFVLDYDLASDPKTTEIRIQLLRL